jgi:hypothetical protein
MRARDYQGVLTARRTPAIEQRSLIAITPLKAGLLCTAVHGIDGVFGRCVMQQIGFGLPVSIVLALLVCIFLVARIAFWPVRLSAQGYRLRNDYKTGTTIAQLTAFIGWILVIVGLTGIVIGAFAGLSVEFRRWLGVELSMVMMTPSVVLIELGLLVLGLSLVMAGQAARAVFDGTNYIKALLDVTLESKSSDRPASPVRE